MIKNLVLSFIFVLLLCLNAYSDSQQIAPSINISNHWLKIALDEPEPENKIKFLQRALILNKNNYKAMQELGLTYIKIEKREIGQEYLDKAAEIYSSLHLKEEKVSEALPKKYFVKTNIGNIDFYTYHPETVVESSSQKLPEEVSKEKIMLSLYPIDLQKEIISDDNEVDYFLIITNLWFDSLKLEDISLVDESSINVSYFAVEEIYSTDFQNIENNISDLSIPPYATVIVNFSTIADNKGYQRLSVNVSINDGSEEVKQNMISKEIVIK